MGLWSGTLALRRYHVLGDLRGALTTDRLNAALKAHALVPLDPERNEEKSMGWASPTDEQDLNLHTGKVWFGGKLVLTLRMDTLKAPSAEVKRLVKVRQRELEAERKAPLSASALRELKDMIAMDLRRRTPVKTRTVWMVLDPDSNTVLLTSHSKGVNEAFLHLFATTFNVPLDLAGPGLWARQDADAMDMATALRAAKPSAVLCGGFADLRPCIGVPDIAMPDATTDNDDMADRRFLAREFLTWLLFRCSEDGGAEFDGANFAFRCTIGERIRVKALGEGGTDVQMRGVAPSETPDARYMIAGGHSVRECQLFFTQDSQRLFAVTVLADGFDLTRVALPSLLSEEDTEREHERLALIDDLEGMLRTTWHAFLTVRLTEWDAVTLPAIHAWLRESLATG
jgi:hypothetical protein